MFYWQAYFFTGKLVLLVGLCFSGRPYVLLIGLCFTCLWYIWIHTTLPHHWIKFKTTEAIEYICTYQLSGPVKQVQYNLKAREAGPGTCLHYIAHILQ